MTTTLYTSKELSNERYHSAEFPQASGSILAEIIDTTPAEFIGGEKKETKALTDGSAYHCCVLEPKQFKDNYVRGIDPADYPNALVSTDDLKSFCRESGIKGFSTYKTKSELTEFILGLGENVEILDVICRNHEKENEGKTVYPAKEYDMIIAMRSALKKLGGYVFTPEMQYEVSCIGDVLKCRWDILVPAGEMAPDGVITKNGEIWDTKSTVSVKPEKFGLQAEKCLYWLKMAIQHDLFLEHFGVEPDRVVLLAQSKKKPYLPQAYKLTKAQLQVGRELYHEAYEILSECNSTGKWPGYGGGVIELPTSGRAAYEFGMDQDEFEIVEE